MKKNEKSLLKILKVFKQVKKSTHTPPTQSYINTRIFIYTYIHAFTHNHRIFCIGILIQKYSMIMCKCIEKQGISMVKCIKKDLKYVSQ